MGARRQGREAALQLLYQIEFSADTTVEAVEEFWRGKVVEDATVRPYAEALVSEVQESKTQLDALIDSAASNWQLGRIARLDLSLLRLAVCELVHHPEIPARVVVNEAVEIARKYCDTDAPAFINGVLDRIARDRGLFEEVKR